MGIAKPGWYQSPDVDLRIAHRPGGWNRVRAGLDRLEPESPTGPALAGDPRRRASDDSGRRRLYPVVRAVGAGATLVPDGGGGDDRAAAATACRAQPDSGAGVVGGADRRSRSATDGRFLVIVWSSSGDSLFSQRALARGSATRPDPHVATEYHLGDVAAESTVFSAISAAVALS